MTVPGINIIGDLTARRGITEAARSTIEAMAKQGIGLSFIDLPYSGFPVDQRDADIGVPIAQMGSVYPVNLIFYGVAGFQDVGDEQLKQATAGKYTIAYWVWEFPTMPERYRAQFARVDGIWTASQFSRQCMLSMTDRPVRVVPHPIPQFGSLNPNRAQFGLSPDRYMFLFVFDAAGSIARKNPEAVIDAFERAFGCPDSHGPLLVMRARHLHADPDYERDLTARLARVRGIVFSDDYSREQTNNLMACTDAYVSLHRTEGFGLTMMEAMALGKSVIATNYSGNTDYMTTANSYLVDYKVRPITTQDHVYQPFFNELYQGQQWAEPDVDQAAQWMRHLVDHSAEGVKRGKLAAEDIQRYCSPAVVGRIIKEYLGQLSL